MMILRSADACMVGRVRVRVRLGLEAGGGKALK
jgi:hypothetical protein